MPIDSRDTDYVRTLPQWRRCRDAFEGEDAIKEAGQAYLPRMEAHDDGEYKAYKLRAMFLPATERTVGVMAGLAFKRQPVVNVPSRMESDVRAHLMDVTLAGEDFDEVCAHALRECLVASRVGVLVEWSESLQRPYWVTFASEEIVSRRFGRMRSGTVALTRVVIERDVPVVGDDAYLDAHRREILELYLDQAAEEPAYRQQKWSPSKDDETKWEPNGPPITPLRNGKPLDRIPFVFVQAMGRGAKICKPPMLDLVSVNLSHYRTSADHEHGCHWTALPTPYVTGMSTRETLTVGGNRAWVIQSHNARVGLLEYSGQGLGALEAALDRKERLMASLGARMLSEGKRAAETAEALRLQSVENTAALADVVESVGKAFTMVLWLHLWWLYATSGPADEHVSVELNHEFVDAKLEPGMLRELIAGVQSGKLSFETFYWNLMQGGIARPGVSAEDERALISQQDEDDAKAAEEALRQMDHRDPPEIEDEDA